MRVSLFYQETRVLANITSVASVRLLMPLAMFLLSLKSIRCYRRGK